MWWRNKAEHAKTKEQCSDGCSENYGFTVLGNGILYVRLPGPIISYDRLKPILDRLAMRTGRELRDRPHDRLTARQGGRAT